MVLALVFSVGGSLLISISFQSSLEQEKAAALQSYHTVRNTMVLANSISAQADADDVVSTLSQFESQRNAPWSALQLTNSSGTLYESGTASYPMQDLTDRCSETNCCLIQLEDGGRHYLQVSGLLQVNRAPFYLSIAYDTDAIYQLRATQLRIYLWSLLVAVLLGAALSWLISYLLTRPLGQLVRLSDDLARGDLSSRAHIRSGDEVEQLADRMNAMAAQLESNISELAAAMQRQEEFMGSFAHELKTPMTSIIGYSDLLRGQDLTPEEQQEAANYIFTESHRLERLSLKLLDLLVLRRQDMELVPGSPAAIITSVVRTLKPALAKQNIVLQCKCQEGQCLLEPDLTKSLVINLVDNARKALEHGGNVVVLSEMTADGCCIQVLDNGRGMPQEDIARITEAFYRVDKSRSRAQGGAGLGLALCAEIVRLNHGDIHFQSKPGKGTCVTVHLNGGRV